MTRFTSRTRTPHLSIDRTSHRLPLLACSALIAALFALPARAGELQGTLTKWHPIEVHFSGGVSLCETSDFTTDGKINPFLHRRLNVTFTHLDALSNPTHSVVVPGFYAGDGAGGSCGNTWVARFTPDDSGTWVYTASFREGFNVNLSLDPVAGSPLLFNGDSDSFVVAPRDPFAPGFLATGRLQYADTHYLRYAEGGFFIKGGTDSPENLFGADAFDDTRDQPGGLDTTGLANGVHRFLPHVADFGPSGLGDSSDPFWTSNIGGDSRGVIGLLNYLSSVQVNSIYFLPMNLGGDGRETYPFIDPSGSSYSNMHYDLSKLHQWNLALNHAQRKGIMWNCVLSETEDTNEGWFGADINELTDERKLFYREMVARFSYLNGIKWNLGEEASYSVVALSDFGDYIAALDPNDHPICFHTNVLTSDGDYPKYNGVLGDPLFSANSLQYVPADASDHVERWRLDSALRGQKWVVDCDEQALGLLSTNQDQRRKDTLYDVLFSGGNIEWYFGVPPFPEEGDLTAEDLRSRAQTWDTTFYARRFLFENVPFQRMYGADELLSDESANFGGGELFALEGHSYAIYLPSAQATGQLDLPTGNYTLRWFNPRTGQFVGNSIPLLGSASTPLGPAPSPAGQDWVALVKRSLGPGELSFSPLYPGVPETLNEAWISGASPGFPMLVFFSVNGTTTTVLQGCGGVTFNLLNEVFGLTLVANGKGERKLSVNITPGPSEGTKVYLQALSPLECASSNVSTFTW